MSLKISALTSNRKYGAQVRGLTESDISSEAVKGELRELWNEHGLIVFKGNASVGMQIELSRIFGDLEHHPIKELRVDGHPELFSVKHDPEVDPWVYEVGGKALGAWQPWHFDLAFVPHSSRGALLRSVTLPSEGGLTGFVDGVEAYESLPEQLKARIEDAEIVYQIEADIALLPYAARAARASVKMLRGSEIYVKSMKERQARDFPPVLHKVVLKHPRTGRKLLHVSPQEALRIHEFEAAESHEILCALIDHLTDPKLAYYHEWSPEDMLLWDNWRMIHTATGIPAGGSREMQRTTIMDEYVIGRLL